MLLCVVHHPLDAETTSYLENKKRSFSVGIGWLRGRSLRTTRNIAQIFLGVVFNVSSHLLNFVVEIECM